MNERYDRLLGARDGLVSALIAARNIRGSITGPGGCYLPPARHTIKRRTAEVRIAEINKVCRAIESLLDDVKKALKTTQYGEP